MCFEFGVKEMKKQTVKILSASMLLSMLLVGCGNNNASSVGVSSNQPATSENIGENSSAGAPNSNDASSVNSSTNTSDVKTIAEAIEIAQKAGDTYTSEKYIIKGKIKNISSYQYGEMTIEDSTGSLYIYGVYGKNGEYFDTLDPRPAVGDEVTLQGSLHTHNSTPEMGKATLLELTPASSGNFDESNYSVKTIAQAHDAAADTLVKVSGVVAQTNVNSSKTKIGFWLVDNSGSIYVYSQDVATKVEVGNKITICGKKVYFIASTEQSNAEKWGYKGCNQLTEVTLTSNDKGKNAYDKSWIKETTVKAMMEKDYSEDVTNTIYKVNALVRKDQREGFLNYYIDDIDGKTGTYVYTQANGGDLSFLAPFDGKICTVYLAMINAKSSATGCVWRCYPIEVIDENYKFDTKNAASYAIEYELMNQFEDKYQGDPEYEVKTTVSSELLGFTGVTVSYKSSNEDAFYFSKDVVTVDGTSHEVLRLHTKNPGTATITVTATYGANSASATKEVTYAKPAEYKTITVGQAVETADNTEVIVEGIVTGGYTNKNGFFLSDASGVIPVLPTDGQTTCNELSIGNKVIVKGKRVTYKKSADGNYFGQIQIESAEVLTNLGGNNEISSASYIKDKAIEEIIELAQDGNTAQPKAYSCKAYVSVYTSQYSSSLNLTEGADTSAYLGTYCSSASQYSWLSDVFGNKEVTVDFMLVNPNAKTYWRAVPFAAHDGTTTVYNTMYLKK